LSSTVVPEVAVTGASGHIGANLVRLLLDSGRRVRVLVHRDTAALEGLDVERVPGDVLDPSSLRTAFDGVEVVYHLAAIITLKPRRDARAQEVNVEGTRNVVAACETQGVRRLIHFCSIHAFSPDPKDGVIDETRLISQDSHAAPYDRSKADGDRVVQAAVARGLDAVVLHPTGVLGPHDYKPSAMGRVLLDLCRRRLPAAVQGGFNWVDARDVCLGAMAAERTGRRGERYLLAGHYLSVPDLVRMVTEIAGVKPPLLGTMPMALARLGIPFAAVAGRLTGSEPRFTGPSLQALRQHQRISHAKAARELGYAPRPLRQTVEDSIQWFRESGRL